MATLANSPSRIWVSAASGCACPIGNRHHDRRGQSPGKPGTTGGRSRRPGQRIGRPFEGERDRQRRNFCQQQQDQRTPHPQLESGRPPARYRATDGPASRGACRAHRKPVAGGWIWRLYVNVHAIEIAVDLARATKAAARPSYRPKHPVIIMSGRISQVFAAPARRGSSGSARLTLAETRCHMRNESERHESDYRIGKNWIGAWGDREGLRLLRLEPGKRPGLHAGGHSIR